MLRAVLAGVLTAGLVAGGLVGGTAAAADPTIANTTTIGVHNTYDPAAYQYLAQSLDAGTGLVELDVWPDIVTHEWKVSHSNPLGNDNNCVAASSAADLYQGGTNKDLDSCLDDLRVWYAAHPDRGPLMLKLEMKVGFSDNGGLGPDELDATLHAHLGSAAYTPAQLMAGHSSLDEAAKANAWPSRDALHGKIITEVIPGTVEEGNPTDSLHTDVEYAQHLKSLQDNGKLTEAQVFPAVHGAASGDPRTKYDAALRPWFVVFDGDAGAYVSGIDTSWYDTNHYLLIMTDAQNVAPAIDDHNPTVDQAAQRAKQLAAAHASILTSDWTGLTTVLPQVLTRG